ncbi:MAG: hypothetical protein E3J70_08975 [Candidatus Heimdallarchaeota archaeon]|nr:MAG: hypothetical protein E3J70_08975 [Candidatus Heimdallarchaeota archaeon]
MSEEKKKRGRPRVYDTNAARKKAYRERKKAERKELEVQIEKMEKDLEFIRKEIKQKDLTDNPFLLLTYKDLRNASLEQLDEYSRDLIAIIGGQYSLLTPLQVIVKDIINQYTVKKIEDWSIFNPNQKIAIDVSGKILDFYSIIQNLTLLNLIDLELKNRGQDKKIDIELEEIEKQIFELEEEFAEKRKVKLYDKTD